MRRCMRDAAMQDCGWALRYARRCTSKSYASELAVNLADSLAVGPADAGLTVLRSLGLLANVVTSFTWPDLRMA